MNKYFLVLVVSVLLSGCLCHKATYGKKDDGSTGTVELVITTTIGDKPLYFDSVYKSPAGEKFSVTSLRFFLSDIALAKSTGTENAAITETANDVYFMDEGKEGQSCKIQFKVKEGSYSDIRFNIGVPRALNHADPATAKYPLDLSNGEMYWNWNSGYIFFLAEGKGEDVYKNSFHLAIGSDQRIMPFSFGNLFDVVPLINVEKDKVTTLKFNFDFNEFLTNADKSSYSFKTFDPANVHGGYYADMLRLNILNALHFVSANTK